MKGKNNKLLKEVAFTEDHTEYKIEMTIEKSSVVRLFKGIFLFSWRSKEVIKDVFLRKLSEELREHIKL